MRQGQEQGLGLGLGLRGDWAGGLAFWSSVLAQERGDGAGFSDFLGERALQVFDGRVSAGLQQELDDIGKLTCRCCRGREGEREDWEERNKVKKRERKRIRSKMVLTTKT